MTTQITALPAAPSTAAPTTFATLADAFIAALATFVTQANTQATENNANAVSAAASQVSCTASAATALAASNFKGTWASRTGAAAVPYAVSYGGRYWQLLQALADVTTITPGTNAAYWQVIGSPSADFTATTLLQSLYGAFNPS